MEENAEKNQQSKTTAAVRGVEEGRAFSYRQENRKPGTLPHLLAWLGTPNFWHIRGTETKWAKGQGLATRFQETRTIDLTRGWGPSHLSGLQSLLQSRLISERGVPGTGRYQTTKRCHARGPVRRLRLSVPGPMANGAAPSRTNLLSLVRSTGTYVQSHRLPTNKAARKRGVAGVGTVAIC